jgi:hypothetical protein
MFSKEENKGKEKKLKKKRKTFLSFFVKSF